MQRAYLQFESISSLELKVQTFILSQISKRLYPFIDGNDPFFVTLQTEARQAPLSMEFSRQEYWHGLPFPSAGDLPDPGIKPGSPALQTDSLQSEPPRTPPHTHSVYKIFEVMNKNFPKIMTENKRQAQGS